MGVVLALNYSKLPVSNNKVVNNILAIVAVLLFMVPAFFITKKDIFPSYNAFFVCLGACLTIYLGKCEEKTFLTRFLSIKPIVFIGLISYSLYLWHWVVFSSIKVSQVEVGLLMMSFVIALLIVIAYLSWKFVEQPFRKDFKWSFSRTFLTLFFVPVLLSVLITVASKKTLGFKDLRFKDNNLVHTFAIEAKDQKNLCLDNILKSKGRSPSDCAIGSLNKQEIDVALYGDSHANSMGGFVDSLLKEAGLRGTVMSDSSSFYLTGIENYAGKFFNTPSILKVSKGVEKNLLESSYKYIVIAGAFASYRGKIGSKDFNNIFEDTIKLIISRGSIPVIIKDIYSIKEEQAVCPIYNNMFNQDNNCNVSFSKVKEIQKNEDELFEYLSKKYDSLVLIDPKEFLCEGNTCYASLDNTSLYVDNNHISYLGSKYIANKYLEKYDNPFKQEEHKVSIK